MTPSSRDPRFPTTHWSLVVRLKSRDGAEARRAVEEVFTTYRYPLYSYLRRSGLVHEDAEDVLQGFFEKMLRNDSLGDADRERGKLRTFLLTALSRFKLNWHRSEQRRQLRVQTESHLWDVDEARWQQEKYATDQSPERDFDRQWAIELITTVRQQLRQRYERRGRLAIHDALSPFIGGSAGVAHPGNPTLGEKAIELGITDNAVRMALHRLRSDFRDLLLKEVSRTLDEGEDAREELRHLIGLFEG